MLFKVHVNGTFSSAPKMFWRKIHYITLFYTLTWNRCCKRRDKNRMRKEAWNARCEGQCKHACPLLVAIMGTERTCSDHGAECPCLVLCDVSVCCQGPIVDLLNVGVLVAVSSQQYLNIFYEISSGTECVIRNPWDQTRFGNRNFSDFGMVVRGIRGQELSESIAQLISTNW
jgi:hypothetical protein